MTYDAIDGKETKISFDLGLEEEIAEFQKQVARNDDYLEKIRKHEESGKYRDYRSVEKLVFAGSVTEETITVRRERGIETVTVSRKYGGKMFPFS
jgi:hypothetical protein